MTDKETILVAPLNWGLGHAARMVPLIHNYCNMGHKVIIAAEGAPLEFLKQEFPTLQYLVFKGYRVRYAPQPFFMVFLLLQMPLFLFSFWIEKYRLNKFIAKYALTTVISDNRYGVFHKKIKSIFITHQIFIQLPGVLKPLESMLAKINRRLIERFAECWVPDYENMEDSLAGTLSHGTPLPKNTTYIGPLSRFMDLKLQEYPLTFKAFDVLVLISGPEPYRTLFEQEMLLRYRPTAKQVLLVCGKPNTQMTDEWHMPPHITRVPHLKTEELFFHLTHASHIVSRSGYSTLMDLHFLGLTAELIPTPGQTEQEYLAAWHQKGLSRKA